MEGYGFRTAPEGAAFAAYFCICAKFDLPDTNVETAWMATAKKRLTLDLDMPIQRRLKVIAALKGMSMRRYCQAAIDKELAREEAQGLADLPFGARS